MCLQSDKDELVRVEALKALSVCAKPNDPLTLSVLVNSVTDASAAVRQRAPLLLAFLTLAQPRRAICISIQIFKLEEGSFNCSLYYSLPSALPVLQ